MKALKQTTTEPKARRGRPQKAEKAQTVRISPRFPAHLAERIQRAADWRGVSVGTFVLEAAVERAEAVMEKEARWILNEEAARRVAEMIAHPPAMTEAMKEAAHLAEDVEIRC